MFFLLSNMSVAKACRVLVFFLPTIGISLYIFFIFQATKFGEQFVEYSRSLEGKSKTDEQNQMKTVAQYLFELDQRFEQDERDKKGFSKIATFDFSEENFAAEPQHRMTFQKFYHDYLSYNLPAIFKHAVKSQKAFTTWQSDEYLSQKIGHALVATNLLKNNADLKKGENEEELGDDASSEDNEITFDEFLAEQKSRVEAESVGIFEGYLDLPVEISSEINEPSFGVFMNLQSSKLVHVKYYFVNEWGDIKQASKSSKPKEYLAKNRMPTMQDADIFICQVSGSVTLVLVPPTQKRNLHLKINDEEGYTYSPIDFFYPDKKAFPNFQSTKGKMRVELHAGDMLYVPAFWWVQSESTPDTRLVSVEFAYTPNYMQMILQSIIDEANFLKEQPTKN